VLKKLLWIGAFDLAFVFYAKADTKEGPNTPKP
jgi:hypothetical protein